MEYIKLQTKLAIFAALIIFVCLLLIGSFIVSTKMQALAQQPDHFYTPQQGGLIQTPETLTLPLQSQK